MSQPAAPSTPSLTNWLEIAALGVIWGASFMAIHLALDGFGPMTIAAGRIALGAMVLLAICRAIGLRLPSWRDQRGVWLAAIGMGFFSNVLPFSLLSWAQQHVTSGFAGISMAMIPLITLSLAHFFVPGERMTTFRLIGFVFGLLGVAVLIGTDAVASGGGTMEPLARILCLSSTLSYATGAIITRRSPTCDPVAFSGAALLSASLMIVPLALWAEGLPDANPPLHAIGALVYLGLMPTAAATLLLVHVIRTAGPTFLSQTNYHVPLWSVVFGTLILAEPLPAQFLAALGLILAGLAVSRIKRRGLGGK